MQRSLRGTAHCYLIIILDFEQKIAKFSSILNLMLSELNQLFSWSFFWLHIRTYLVMNYVFHYLWEPCHAIENTYLWVETVVCYWTNVISAVSWDDTERMAGRPVDYMSRPESPSTSIDQYLQTKNKHIIITRQYTNLEDYNYVERFTLQRINPFNTGYNFSTVVSNIFENTILTSYILEILKK